MSVDYIFLLRLVVAPLLVGGMSLVARRFGPTIAGILMGVPWMTAPVMLFLALDKGQAWGSEAAAGVLLAVAGLASFMVGYSLVARRAPWPYCLTTASLAFFAAALLVRELGLDLAGVAIVGASSLIGGFLIVPPPAEPVTLGRLPWWDIPVRMLATALLVAVIMLSADRLGPALSGIIASFPVITTVVVAFSHYRWGAAAATLMLRSLLLSLLSFIGFFLVLGWALVPLGIPVAFALATCVSIAGGTVLTLGLRAVSRRGGVR